uniref:BZIP domain-containing protein n=1 Tax=Anopheles christyi TaxID=43041 RepID=A0A182KDS2_9DIPT
MESPQMYDTNQIQVRSDIKKLTMAANNSIQYSQSELDELTSQEISLDLQHLIDDQFRDPEALGIFTEMVTVGSTNGTMANPLVQTAAAKALQLQQARLSQHTNGGNSYQRSLAYMPQPVHTGAAYGSTSSDENSSVGSSTSDSANIKEEPVDPNEYRRQLLANGGSGGAQFMGTINGLTPATVLHHQALPHLSGAAHLANLTKHSKMLPHVGRKTQQKQVDKGTDEYRRRRERNNIAVRKSREKAKVRSREVEEKVKTLLKEKDVLIRKIEEKNNEIALYKQLYMHLMNHSNPEINQICRSALNLSNMGDHM